MMSEHRNQLSQETSPYLLQHADNPVEWYPWNQDALEKARTENKPILLSIGYSACHWCHVMAHESFEDKATAKIMNDHFINIKVDREERPDLDKIYQRAHQILTQRTGGWPLTMFLMPDDHVPFFGGTYFPKQAHYNLPAFTDLLNHIADFYSTRADELREQNASLMQAIKSLQPATATPETALSPAPLDVARRQLEASVDWKYGGFGKAPKFPHPTNIERLLRHWAGSGKADSKALEIACYCLRQMGLGGINDQLGGGFCRYSVDEYWMIPHFEKMLYDNGPLICLYSEAYSATEDPLFKDIAEKTTEWVLREMQSTEGGYYSSLDADSEGEEGKFYSWEQDEAREILTEEEYKLFAMRFGLDREANFEGKWYPHVFTDWKQVTGKSQIDEDEAHHIIDSARSKLFLAREQRVRPGRDEKILTSWNALMIKGMASAGRHLDRSDLIESAEKALDFIRTTLWQGDHLLATYKDGRAHLNAYLDDYVFLIDAILELVQTRWRDGELEFAMQLADATLKHFEDKVQGGFYFTADNHEALIDRPKTLGDEAIPSGNGIAATVFGRLGHLLGDTRYLEAAERTLKAAWSSIEEIPYAHNALLVALEEYLYPPQTIILRGKDEKLDQWRQRCTEPYAPRRMSIAIPEDAENLPGILNERKCGDEDILAYICSGTSCSAPVSSYVELDEQLKKTEAKVQIKWE